MTTFQLVSFPKCHCLIYFGGGRSQPIFDFAAKEGTIGIEKAKKNGSASVFGVALTSETGRMSATARKEALSAATPLGREAEEAEEQAGAVAWAAGQEAPSYACWMACKPPLGAPPEKFLALPRVEPAQSGYLSKPKK